MKPCDEASEWCNPWLFAIRHKFQQDWQVGGLIPYGKENNISSVFWTSWFSWIVALSICVRVPWGAERLISPSALQFNRGIRMRNSVCCNQWERSRRGHGTEPDWCLWGAPQKSLCIFVQQHDKKRKIKIQTGGEKKREGREWKEERTAAGKHRQSLRKCFIKWLITKVFDKSCSCGSSLSSLSATRHKSKSHCIYYLNLKQNTVRGANYRLNYQAIVDWPRRVI